MSRWFWSALALLAAAALAVVLRSGMADVVAQISDGEPAASDRLERALGLDPDRIDLRVRLASLHFARGDAASARALLAADRSTRLSAEILRAALEQEAGHRAAAAAAWDRVGRWTPSDRPTFQNRLAAHADDPTATAALAREARLRFGPGADDVAAIAGLALTRDRDPIAALRGYRLALALDAMATSPEPIVYRREDILQTTAALLQRAPVALPTEWTP